MGSNMGCVAPSGRSRECPTRIISLLVPCHLGGPGYVPRLPGARLRAPGGASSCCCWPVAECVVAVGEDASLLAWWSARLASRYSDRSSVFYAGPKQLAGDKPTNGMAGSREGRPLVTCAKAAIWLSYKAGAQRRAMDGDQTPAHGSTLAALRGG